MSHKPRTLNIKGEEYTLCLFKVIVKDAQGQPLQLLMLHDRDVIAVDTDEKAWFITAYVPTCNLTS